MVEMARLACALDDRPLPDGDAPVVIQCLPSSPSAAVVAVDHAGQPLGARSAASASTVNAADARRFIDPRVDDGGGRWLLAARALGRPSSKRWSPKLSRSSLSMLALNVHLRNPAARLYMRAGFRVAGKGRGRFGIAMTRDLRP